MHAVVGGQVMIGSPFIADGAGNDNQIAHRDVLLQHAAAPASDAFPTTKGNDLFEQTGCQRGTDARMKESQASSLVGDFVDRMRAIFPGVLHEPLGMVFSHNSLNHVFEETDHTMLRHVSRLNDPGGFNKGNGGGVMLKDWIDHKPTSPGCPTIDSQAILT